VVDPDWRCISGLLCDIVGESRVLIYMVDELSHKRYKKRTWLRFLFLHQLSKRMRSGSYQHLPFFPLALRAMPDLDFDLRRVICAMTARWGGPCSEATLYTRVDDDTHNLKTSFWLIFWPSTPRTVSCVWCLSTSTVTIGRQNFSGRINCKPSSKTTAKWQKSCCSAPFLPSHRELTC